MKKAQGSLEYLVIIAAVLIVTGVTVLFIAGSAGSSSTAAMFTSCQQAAQQCKLLKAANAANPCKICYEQCVDPRTGEQLFADGDGSVACCLKGDSNNIYEDSTGACTGTGTFTAVCGNGVCEFTLGETLASCPADCSGTTPTTCTSGATQACTTTQSCAGTQTCTSGVWGACTDVANDGCPATVTCDNDGTCDTGEDATNCPVDCGSIACSSDTACSDSNECTTDVCTNPGTVSSSCTHTSVADGTACTGGTCTAGVCSAATEACTVAGTTQECYTDGGVCIGTQTCSASLVWGTCVKTLAACPSCVDNDLDNYGNQLTSTNLASCPITSTWDCNDNSPYANPGRATETTRIDTLNDPDAEALCADGADNDCDALVDCLDTTDCLGTNYCKSQLTETCTNGIDDNINLKMDCEEINTCVANSFCTIPDCIASNNCFFTLGSGTSCRKSNDISSGAFVCNDELYFKTADAIIDMDMTSAQNGFAVSITGKMFKTTTYGKTWKQIDLIDNSGNNIIVGMFNEVDFINENLGYAIGSIGTSPLMIKTTNGGETWTILNIGTTSLIFSMDFIDSHNGWITLDDKTVKFTNTGGTSWTTKGSTPSNAYSVDFIDVLNGYYIGVDFYKTKDGGATWTKLKDTATVSNIGSKLDMTSKSLGCYITEGNVICNTTTTTTFTTKLSTSDTINSISFKNMTHGWAVGMSLTTGKGIAYSTINGGDEWTQWPTNTNKYFITADYTLGSDETAEQGEKCVGGSCGFAIGNSGLILRSTNLGKKWSELTPLGTLPLVGIDFRSIYSLTNEISIHAFSSVYSYYSSDGGTIWSTPQNFATGKTFNALDTYTKISDTGSVSYEISVLGDSGAYYAYSNGMIIDRSIDTITDKINSVDVLQYSSPIGYAGGNTGKIYKLTSNGLSEIATIDTTGVYGIDFIDINTGWAVTGDGGVYRTGNGGTDWYSYTNVGAGTNSLLSVDFIDYYTGWIGDSIGNVYYTTDGGTTWTKKATGSGGMIRDIQFLDSKVGFIAGRSSLSKSVIYRTENGGSSWTKVYEGTTNSDVKSLDFLIGQDEVIEKSEVCYDYPENCVYASTSDGWVLKSYDFGETFFPISRPTLGEIKSITFTDKNIGYLTQSSVNIKRIYKTADGAKTWTYATLPVDITNIGKIDMINSNRGYLVASDFSGNVMVFKTINAGSSWTSCGNTNLQASSIGLDIDAVEGADASKDFVMVSGTNILKASVITGCAGFAFEYTGRHLIDINTIGSQPVYFSVYREGENTWESVSRYYNGITYDTKTKIISSSIPSFKNIKSMDFMNNYIGFIAGESGKIFKTSDGANTWITSNSEIPSDFNPSIIEIKPDSINVINSIFIAGTIDSNVGKVYKSTDTGVKWISSILPPETKTITDLSTYFGSDEVKQEM